jgi:hypothetical protein
MNASKSLTLFENPEYGVRLEYNKQFAIVHLPYTNKMNKKVFLDMESRLSGWYDFITTAGYKGIWCAVPPDDVKINKLVTMLKFKYMGKSDGMSVYKYGD